MFRNQKSKDPEYKGSRLRWLRADNLNPLDLVFDKQGKPWIIQTVTKSGQNYTTGIIGVEVVVAPAAHPLKGREEVHYVYAQTRYLTQRFNSWEKREKKARRAQNK